MTELDQWFRGQLKVSREIVTEFIDSIFGQGEKDAVRHFKTYEKFFTFNFDYLNYEHRFFASGESHTFKGWCHHPRTVFLPKIEAGFCALTGIHDPHGLEKLSCLNNRRFRDCADPDSMKIVCHILFLIYSDIIYKTLRGLDRDDAERILNKGDLTALFKGDTMHSFHTSFGKAEYRGEEDENGEAVKSAAYEYIFMLPYISGFSKVPNLDGDTLACISSFFNQYHTLGNFVLTPAICVEGLSINQERYRCDRDNYYAYLEELFQNGALKAGLSKQETSDTLSRLVGANQAFFGQFSSREQYCTELDILEESGRDYALARERAIREPTRDSIQRYVELTNGIIETRCRRMIEKLFYALQGPED